MLNFFNNIKKKDDNDNDDDVKEHYMVSYKPGGEFDLVSFILFGLVIFFTLVGLVFSGYEWWQQKKQQKLIKTNNVVNGSVPVLPTVSTAPAVSAAPAVPVVPVVPVVPIRTG